MDTLKTIHIDIAKSVFNNDTEGILYITKDIYSDNFIIAIPVITFSWEINNENDYNDLLKLKVLGEIETRERLVNVIKEGISNFK